MEQPQRDDRPGPFDQTRLFRTRSRRHLMGVARRLEHFRIVPGFGGDSDLLVAQIAGADAAELASGLERMGLGPADGQHPRTFRTGRVHVATAANGHAVRFMPAANTPDQPWSFGEADVRLAEELEIELIGADWFDAFLEPEHAVTPATYPSFFAR